MKPLYFVAGFFVGSGITYILTKKKFANKADEEIREIREYYRKKDNNEEEAVSNDVKEEMGNIIKNYSSVSEQKRSKEDDEIPNSPRVIDEEDFGELEDEGYETASTYILYANGILTDSMKNVIDSSTIRKCIGTDILEEFMDSEEDAIYIRNDECKMDYEIIKDVEDYINPVISG